MKRGLLLISLLAVAGSSQAIQIFAFGQDAGVAPGSPFANSAQSQRDYLSFAAAYNSVSALNYEFSALGAGVTAYSPLAGVTVSMTNADAAFSGVKNTDEEQLGWNTTMFGSKHLRFAANFNANDAYVSFQFGSLINSFSTLYNGQQNDFPGDFSMEGFKNGVSVWGMSQSKPAPVGNLTGVGHLGYFTDESAMFFDEVRFYSRGDRSNTRDVIGLDDAFFTYCQTVPEPATMAVLGLGAAALLRRRRK